MMSSIATRAARAARGLGRFVQGVMGETAYASYVAHEHAAHPGRAVLSERDFWVQRYREQDLDPSGRCC